MTWTIRRCQIGWEAVREDGELVARMNLHVEGKIGHPVIFADTPKFNWECGTTDQFIGYVRGVERAVLVHALETRGGAGVGTPAGGSPSGQPRGRT